MLKVIFPLNSFTIVVRNVSESANLMFNQQEWNVETYLEIKFSFLLFLK